MVYRVFFHKAVPLRGGNPEAWTISPGELWLLWPYVIQCGAERQSDG
jgi:hypothetical protein